ncbi:hypothetical protein HYO15_10430 [Vibrio parahaemolyticus]|nr:hypothetical protein [Vibrio parahaemolyticus]MBM4998702.1 hypothetical protein [Vibrio parahaemolyticus]MDN4732926.1 hypothetical protein [Vibrio parahaemolyticus]HCG7982936.1 hypothetical protein [Vibrio parahaemolyticus]
MNHATTIGKRKLKILYIDIGPLLLSTNYLNQRPEMRAFIERSLSISTKEFLKQIELDPNGVAVLNDFSNQYGILLFPLGSVFSRKFLIEQGLDCSCLAPEKVVNLRLDDNDMVRNMLSHAYKSNADWRVVGDLHLNDMELSNKLFTGRYIKIDNISGITEKLVERIKASFDTIAFNDEHQK